jgi:hypothetical protein
MASRYSSLGPAGINQQQINKALADGTGGMQFTAMSPPGVGRLIRIPFYNDVGINGYASVNNQAAPVTPAVSVTSVTHPGIVVNTPAAAGVTPTVTLQTPQISWASLRIVGFESNVNYPQIPAGPVMEVCFSDLQIGGGANLFVHEDFAPAGIYLMGQDSFAGLRDYPLLISPNTATVQVQAVGNTAAAGSTMTLFTCNLVCEILQDDNYGAHIPGPYARGGAMVRQGGSFV